MGKSTIESMSSGYDKEGKVNKPKPPQLELGWVPGALRERLDQDLTRIQ